MVIVTGSLGLVGRECMEFFGKTHKVIGIDNNFRSRLLRTEEQQGIFSNTDIRDYQGLEVIFSQFGSEIDLIIHTAGQPSHDLAASIPIEDFEVNAKGTLNLLELTRKYCPSAIFVFTSSNKVYGDTPNQLSLVELPTRYEFSTDVNESMTLDTSTHSLMGCSKLAADIYVQEYGRYFGLNTATFRCGCITGPKHAGAKLHGFLNYLVKCGKYKIPYCVIGYEGKQVRDNIHVSDLVTMFDEFYKNPHKAEVYNAGGGRFSNCSVLEAIEMVEEISGDKMQITFESIPRKGDHIWYISDTSKFQSHYPNWSPKYRIKDIIKEIYEFV